MSQEKGNVRVDTTRTKEVIIEGKTFYFHMGSTGMSDLMRRLYMLRSQCGVVEDLEHVQNKQELDKRRMKKMDQFELNKVEIVQRIDETKDFILQRETDKYNIEIKQKIRKGCKELDRLFLILKNLQQDATTGQGIWSSKSIPEDIKKQREADIILIEQHIRQLKSRNRKLDASDKIIVESSSSRTNNIDSVESMENDFLEELPTIDISEGIQQIQEQKQVIDRHLDVLSSQLDKMSDLAHNFEDELEMQKKMLEKIDTDVKKYTKQIGTINKRLDWAVKKVGGTTKLLIIAILIIVLIILFGAIYTIVISFVNVDTLFQN